MHQFFQHHRGIILLKARKMCTIVEWTCKLDSLMDWTGGGRAASFGRHVQFHSICQSQCKWGKFFCIVKKISRNSFTREFYLQWRHVSIILWRKLCILLHVNKILQIHVLFKYQVTFVYCRKWFASLPLIWRREIFNMLFIVSKWAGALLFYVCTDLSWTRWWNCVHMEI